MWYFDTFSWLCNAARVGLWYLIHFLAGLARCSRGLFLQMRISHDMQKSRIWISYGPSRLGFDRRFIISMACHHLGRSRCRPPSPSKEERQWSLKARLPRLRTESVDFFSHKRGFWLIWRESCCRSTVDPAGGLMIVLQLPL